MIVRCDHFTGQFARNASIGWVSILAIAFNGRVSVEPGPAKVLFQHEGDLALGARLNQLRGQGMSEARLYGEKEYGGLHALFLLTDKPEAYGLPNTESAVLPSRNKIGRAHV